ncbi:FHA domain-containing protein [Actinidia chinensis var. chinensis]|uniref:FHA domain-containing protein n=1 Tax=Actinidia chinensis var. chinensis TaxID=1590841 RepID=A0A2R6PRK4_ACTCC|nr:FHA domain-containing protein [Actinidia chinensis var. chinensis]
MGRNVSGHSESPVRGRGSPRRRSLSRRERSPAHHRSSHKASSPPREKPEGRTRSPKRVKPRSPVHRSPSPRTKRLRRIEAERGSEKVSEREHARTHNRAGDKDTHRERGSDREVPSEKRERRLGRDAADRGSSRSRHGRSTSPSDRHHRSRDRSHSPHLATDNSEVTNSKGAEYRNGDNESVAKMKATEEALETKEKQKPSFELSGKLAAETNRVKGVTLLFNEPSEARKPDIRWRLYVFKAGEVLNEPLYVHRQTCYLFGRERRVADIPTDHPSCSKQHAVLQYRQVEKEQPDGTSSKHVRPYLMDLGSTNGTFVNDNRIESQRYYELFERDTIKFGNSSREYVLLHENSAT